MGVFSGTCSGLLFVAYEAQIFITIDWVGILNSGLEPSINQIN